MNLTTLLLVLLLIAVLAVLGLSLALLLRRPEERIGDLLRDEQRAGRGELRGQLEGFALQQGQRIDGFGGQLQAV
ncbi:MAG: DNA recombination protein RmuC, partial [Lysobacteraceae bacterium]